MPSDVDISTRESNRRRFIISELEFLGIACSESPIYFALVDEIYHAIFSMPHEGTLPTYGVILTKSANFDDYSYDDLGAVSTFQLSELVGPRKVADGLSTFVWRTQDLTREASATTVLSFSSNRFAGEVETFNLRDKALSQGSGRSPSMHQDDFTILQRVDGQVRIFCGPGVIQIKDNRWHLHRYQYSFLLDDFVESTWPDRPHLVACIRFLSQLAIHLLRPEGVGATIVWLTEPLDINSDPAFNTKDALNFGAYPHDKPLGFQNRKSLRAIASLIGQTDGALIVSPDGKLSHAKVWLNVPEAATRGSIGGTRQRSALEASARIPGFVLTVSSDGPTRVFYKGEMVLSTEATIAN